MDWNTFLLMRHEIVLTIIILFVLLADIFTRDKKSINYIAIGLFAVYTAIGFMPLESGVLFGGMFVSTPLVVAFKNILNIGVLILLLISASWVNQKMLPLQKVAEYYALVMSSYLGMLFMISAGNFLMLYLGLELATLPVAALASYDMFNRKSSEAGIKLILSAAFSSGIFLFGISMIYAITGSLYFDAIAGQMGYSYLSIMALIMLFAGLAFKISLVPFHFWTADVYEGAPTPVASFLSVISKGSAVFVLMILLFKVFNDMDGVWIYLLYGISILTMFVGNFFALRQQNLQRFLAFSSVAQAGFILLGFLSADQLAVSSVVYFIAIYVLSNIVVFGAVQAIGLASGKYNIDDYNGLYRSNPMISIALMFGLFSLAGIPPIAGFFGKFFLYTSAASQGYYWLVFIAVVNVTISLYYYLLVIRASWLRTSENSIKPFKSDPLLKIGVAVAAFGLLVLGMMAPFYDYIYTLSNIFN
jgi:NADH-quinone oxidoreductase subunit N